MWVIIIPGGNQDLVVVDVVGEGHVQVTCKPSNSDTEFLVWQGIDITGQATTVSSFITSTGYLVLSVPADASYNQSIFTCYTYQASSSQVLTILIASILFQGIACNCIVEKCDPEITRI